VNDTIIKLPNGDFTSVSHLKNFYYNNGYLGESKKIKLHEYMIIDNKAEKIHNIFVHTFIIGDVEDPDLYAAEPLWQWQQSEMGQWVMERSVETPMWHRQADPMSYGHQYAVEAWLKGADYTFWVLKWGNLDKKDNR
jgi:hypothetical protein